MRLRQRHCIWRSFTDCPSIDILYYPEERDDKGELIKAGHYVLLRRATLLSQPENEKVYSSGDYVAVCSKTTDWFMCVISEINDPSKEVKVRFMRKSGQYFLLGKKLEKWFPKPDASYPTYHPLTIACVIPESICDKIKTLDRYSRWTFIFANHSSNDCNKKEVVDIDKEFNCL